MLSVYIAGMPRHLAILLYQKHTGKPTHTNIQETYSTGKILWAHFFIASTNISVSPSHVSEYLLPVPYGADKANFSLVVSLVICVAENTSRSLWA